MTLMLCVYAYPVFVLFVLRHNHGRWVINLGSTVLQSASIVFQSCHRPCCRISWGRVKTLLLIVKVPLGRLIVGLRYSYFVYPTQN